MALYKKYILLLYLSISKIVTPNYTSFLPLPAEFAKRPIYYVYASQLNGFSCGYNVLYNACCLEHAKLRYNKFWDKELFKRTVQKYLVSKKAKPHQASMSTWLHELARHIGLENFNYLILENNKVRPLGEFGVTVEYIIGTPKHMLKEMVAKAWKKKNNY